MTTLSRRDMLLLTGATVGFHAFTCARAGLRFDPASGAFALARALARREFSALEVTKAAIARIEALDGDINAVVVRDFERALAAAAAADRALSRGERRALLGVPMTVKESFDVAGLATTWGVPEDRNRIVTRDGIEVARLKDEGAVILGKTNVPYKLGDWQTYNDIYGVTCNPWDLRRTPGGSSGGSAAALAAGYVLLELGSDIAGSIRAPAHFCGVYGHKPSAEGAAGAGPLAVFGPMARTAVDLAPALQILLGSRARGSSQHRLALKPARHARLSSYRVLLLDSHPLLPTSRDVLHALHHRAEQLRGLGVEIEQSTALLPDLAASGRLYAQLLDSYNVWNLPQELLRSKASAAPEPDAIQAERLAMAQRWQVLFQRFDVILCPIMPTTAFFHDHSAGLQNRHIDIDGRQVPYLDQLMWAGVATFTGLPATTVPLGLSAEGLPVGAQIVGPFLEDRTTIAFAQLMEEVFGPPALPELPPSSRPTTPGSSKR